MFLKLHPFYAILGLRPRWLKLYNYVHSLLLHTSLKGTQKAGIKVPRSMPPQHTTAMDGGSVDNVRNRFRPSTSMINAASDSSALASCFALTPTSVSSCPLAAYTPSCTCHRFGLLSSRDIQYILYIKKGLRRGLFNTYILISI